MQEIILQIPTQKCNPKATREYFDILSRRAQDLNVHNPHYASVCRTCRTT